MTNNCAMCGMPTDRTYGDDGYCLPCARRSVHGYIAAAEASLEAVEAVVKSAVTGNGSPDDTARTVEAVLDEHRRSGLRPIEPVDALDARSRALSAEASANDARMG